MAHKDDPHVMGLQLGELSYVVVSSPEAAGEVMKTHDLSFATRPWFQATVVVCPWRRTTPTGSRCGKSAWSSC
ncbi:unnamed protein product [Linum trigynum]|uniref:Uroporphyrinogen-III synthase n=1 Tax=Linum trigynum TaxID=586398 RepID=A0AAV2DN09_9ROSI